jgi:hypothetical protein
VVRASLQQLDRNLSVIASMSPDQNDAAALQRVRNRLASSPDDQLPHILSKFLPRLVARLRCDEDNGVVNEEVDPNLVGILDHVRERILFNTTLIQWTWMEPLFEAVVPPGGSSEMNDDSKSVCGYWYIRLLYHTLPLLELVSTVESSECCLPRLLRILECLHSSLPLLSTELAVTEEPSGASVDDTTHEPTHNEAAAPNEPMWDEEGSRGGRYR